MGGRRSSRRQQQHAAKISRGAAPAGTSAQKAVKTLQRSDTSLLAPAFNDVFAAIASLYADELKPFGRILRKRVAEYASPTSGFNEDGLSDVDPNHLRLTCERSDCLQVEPEEGGDWSVLIRGRKATFVDVYSSVDTYPAGMWGAATAYFQLLAGDDMYLPGGRYSCAQVLQHRGLAFLQGRSLGQVCHIVQLAISQKKLLGYLSGSVVPYAFSQSKLKEEAAQLNAPCTTSLMSSSLPGAVGGKSTSEGSMIVATWETARHHMREILESAAKREVSDSAAKSIMTTVGTIPLSNVKRLFRSKFHTELSETMLGHSKLSELLQDERFGDICSVHLQGQGYTVMQVVPRQDSRVCLDDVRSVSACNLSTGEPRSVEDTDGSSRLPPMDGYVGNLVQRTFIHASPPPPTPPPNARWRSASVPGAIVGSVGLVPLPGEDKAEETESCPSSRLSLEAPVKLLLREIEETAGSALLDNEVESISPHRLKFCPDEPLILDEAETFLAWAPLTQTPVGMYTSRKTSESTIISTASRPSLDSPIKLLLRELCHEEIASSVDNGVDGESRQRLKFCPDEPLALDEIDAFLDTAPLTQTPIGMYTSLSLPWQPSFVSDGSCDVDNLLGCVANDEPCNLDEFCLDECPALEKSGPCFDSAPPADTTTTMYTRPAPPRMKCISPLSLKNGRVGSIALSKVQNTFIHSPLPPPTPLGASACRRSLSLPKNVGSDKNAWEATCQALGCSQTYQCQQEDVSNSADALPTPNVYEDIFPYCETNQPESAPRCQPLISGPMWPTSAVDPSLLFDMCSAPPYLVSNFFLPAYPSSQSNVIHLASLLQ